MNTKTTKRDPGIMHPNESYMRVATGKHVTESTRQYGPPAPRPKKEG